MKIFISWSGERSRVVAELMSDWIKCVLQASRPWISTQNIDRGAIWFTEINEQLKDTSAGIVFLTQENKNKPWILFETGALAKGLSTNRVCTFLVDLEPKDLVDPLAQFNHTLPNYNGVWAMISTLNPCLNEQALDARTLKEVFDTYWPIFQEKFNKALESTPKGEEAPPRSDSDLLLEILNTTRNLAHKVRELESDRYSAPIFANTRRVGLIEAAMNQSSTLSDQEENAIRNLSKMLKDFDDEGELMHRLNKLNVPEPIKKEVLKRKFG